MKPRIPPPVLAATLFLLTSTMSQGEEDAEQPKRANPNTHQSTRAAGVGLLGGGSIPLNGPATPQAAFSAVGHYRLTPYFGIGGFGLISSRDNSEAIREFFFLGGEIAAYLPMIYHTLRLGLRAGWIDQGVLVGSQEQKVNPGFVGLSTGFDYLVMEEASFGIEMNLYYISPARGSGYFQTGFASWHILAGIKYWF
jgi:hypothetical protein